MDWQSRSQALRNAFTPSAPVSNQDLFAGRGRQLVRLNDTLHSIGEHAAVFGERGVGKTSLATVMEQLATMAGIFAIRINCAFNDSTVHICQRIGEAINTRMTIDGVSPQRRHDDLRGVAGGATALLATTYATRNDLLTALQILTAVKPVVLFLDEFDRIGDSNVPTDLVDMMKAISDHAMPITVVIVGVADDVDRLIDEHESIGRGLNEIEMPRMSVEELREVVAKGLAQAEMRIHSEAADFIAQLCTGLPHYAHLLGLHAGLDAISGELLQVDVENVLDALPTTVERARQHVTRLYFDATHSTQANNFKEVLLAAALARTDERGYFAPGDLRDPYSAIKGARREIPSFSKQLVAFSDARGPVLDRTGVSTRPRYRFTEPLLVPYISMRGVIDELVSAGEMRTLLSSRMAH